MNAVAGGEHRIQADLTGVVASAAATGRACARAAARYRLDGGWLMGARRGTRQAPGERAALAQVEVEEIDRMLSPWRLELTAIDNHTASPGGTTSTLRPRNGHEERILAGLTPPNANELSHRELHLEVDNGVRSMATVGCPTPTMNPTLASATRGDLGDRTRDDRVDLASSAST